MHLGTAYERDLRILLVAAQEVELGEALPVETLDLAQRSMKEMNTVGDVAHFVIYSDRAREARLVGNIQEALAWEKARESYYDRLPDGLRW